MLEIAKDQRNEWRYVLLLHDQGIPVWLETKRLPGLPETIARIRVKDRYYFLGAHSTFFDTETQKMICFIEIQDSIRVENVTLGPDGEFEARHQPPDTTAFVDDHRFRRIARPF